MRKKLTKKEAIAYVKRWDAVHRMEIQEIQRTSPQEKLSQFLQLSAILHWLPTRIKREGEAEVRRRWRILRNAAAHG